MSNVFIFGEGQTEKVVFNYLKSNFFHDQHFREIVLAKGKGNLRPQIKSTVQSEITPNKDISILVFRDLDENESAQNVSQSFRDLVWELLSDWNLQPSISPHPQFTNIFLCSNVSSPSLPGLRMVLHLADYSRLKLPFVLRNQTTDGYILAAGLTDAVLERFANDSKVNSNKQALYTLITHSIGQVITQANIAFDEEKDYLAAYLCATRFWVVCRTEEQARLASIILERARNYGANTVEQIFVTWKKAIEEALK